VTSRALARALLLGATFATCLSVSATSNRAQRRRTILRARDRPLRRGGLLQTSQAPAPVASLHGVRKSFGAVVALDAIDLELSRGEILALLGPNGAGKSTAVAIMLGLRRPDAGRATLFGVDPRNPASRRQVGAALQDISFPPGLRVRDAIELVRAHFESPEPTEAVLARLDLESLGGRDAMGLSGGQRRRLAVALALAGRPGAVFLDEPTTGMDATARRALLADIVDFARAGGAVLLTTQQLAEAEEIATRVVLLVEGRVILEGTVAEMRARAGLTRVSLRAARLPRLPGVASADSFDGRHVVYVEDADRFVADLVRSGVSFEQLEVTRARLEDAFLVLTSQEDAP
jgi:ABC-2 type transport system ATP-binding protein